jgi:hypothetical protein
MNRESDNPYASPKAPPRNEGRPLRAYFAAAWAGLMAVLMTFAILVGVEVVIMLIFWPQYLRPYKSIAAEVEFWQNVVLAANLIAALPAGAWAAGAKLSQGRND